MISDVIDRARREPPHTVPGTSMVLSCHAPEGVAWDKKGTEVAIGMQVPEDLVTLWNRCEELKLYEDTSSGQWGLVLLSAKRIAGKNNEYRREREDDALPGDLVIGEFRGDLDLAILRMDPSAADYGTVVVARDIGPRSEWHTAGRSLEEFLTRFMDTHGAMYWEPSYKAKQALTDPGAASP